MADTPAGHSLARPGHFLPFSRGLISAPFPIENSHLFHQYICISVFPTEKSKKKKKIFFLDFFFFFFFLETTTTYEIIMILKHSCLSGMVGIIQSKIPWFWGYNNLLYLLCSMSLISPNFAVKSIIFPQFWPEAFSQNCWKKPCGDLNCLKRL